MKYFIKYSPQQAFLDSKGRSIRFPEIAAGYGGMETDNESLIAEFRLAISKSKGGLQEVTAQEFEAIKKKTTSPASSPNSSPFASLKDLKRAGDRLPHAAAGRKDGSIIVPGVGGAVEIPVAKAKISNFKPGSVRR